MGGKEQSQNGGEEEGGGSRPEEGDTGPEDQKTGRARVGGSGRGQNGKKGMRDVDGNSAYVGSGVTQLHHFFVLTYPELSRPRRFPTVDRICRVTSYRAKLGPLVKFDARSNHSGARLDLRTNPKPKDNCLFLQK